MRLSGRVLLVPIFVLHACGDRSQSSVQTTTSRSALLGNGTTIGVVRPDGNALRWFLRSSNSPGDPDVPSFLYGANTDVPVTGDWDGNSSTTIGVVRVVSGTLWWFLDNTNNGQSNDYNPNFGAEGDTPVVGDWDGNGTTTIGVARPDQSNDTFQWFLSNSNAVVHVDVSFGFGSLSLHDIPVAGDWDGDGATSVGVVRPENSTGQLHWLLRNQSASGNIDYDFHFGTTTDKPVMGDWDGNGTVTAGYFRPSTNQWFLTNSSTAGTVDLSFTYDASGAGNTPVTGSWPVTNVSPLGNAAAWTSDTFAGSMQTFVADVDGDGYGDVIALNSDGIVVRRSSGGAPLGYADTWSNTPFSGTVSTFFADVTGDGMADAVAVNSGDVVVRQSTGTGFGDPHSWYTGNLVVGDIGHWMADMDGDGKADLVAFQSSPRAFNVGLSTGASFGFETWTSSALYGDKTFVADVTGDRRADLVAVNGSYITVQRGMAGWTLGPVETWSSTAFHGDVDTFLTDVTGDGLADIVSVGTDGIKMRRSGRWFFSANIESLSAVPPSASATPLMGDLTGDKRADYLEVSANSPIQVRVRQDRRIPIRFLQLASHGDVCPHVDQDASIQAAIDDANLKFRDAGVSFYARASAAGTVCPNLALSTVVTTDGLASLGGPAPVAELEGVARALNLACDPGFTDFATLPGADQLWWLSGRCASPGEIVAFITQVNGPNVSGDAARGKMVLLNFGFGTNLAHELGHYFGVPHNFEVGIPWGMDPLTGQDDPTSAFWDLAFVPASPPAPALFFNNRAEAAAYEPQLTRIQIGTDPGGPTYQSVNGWTCPNTVGSPCPTPALPVGSLAMPLGGDTSQVAYTFVPSISPPQLDPRLKGECPHPGDDRIDPTTGLPASGFNVMSYLYGGVEGAPGGNDAWFSLSQIERIQDALTYDVALSRLDATGHVIFGDRPRLGIEAPPATLTVVPTGGGVMAGTGTLASNGLMAWVVGGVPYSADGNRVYAWNARTRVWDPMAAGATQLALPMNSSTAWAVTAPSGQVKRWNGSSFDALPAEKTLQCARRVVVGTYASTTYAWATHCFLQDTNGNWYILRYDDANGWVSVAGPEPAANVEGAVELAVDWQGALWALANKQGGPVVYKATMGSNGLPTSWTQYAAPAGAVHITGSTDIHGSLPDRPGYDHIPIDVVDSSQGVWVFNSELLSWSPAMTIPFNVREVSGALPYLWVVNDADSSIWYVR